MHILRPIPAQSSRLFPYTTLFRSGPALMVSDSFRLTSRQITGRSFLICACGAVGADERAQPPSKSPSEIRRVRIKKDLRSEEHTSELQSPMYLVCRLLLEKKKNKE